MSSDATDHEVSQWLAQRGHSAEEIAAILARLRQYDKDVVRQSLFEAMETGEFKIEAIIQEALKDIEPRQ